MTLAINNLHVTNDGKEFVKGLTLTIKPGEVHVIMGPNGAGKSTLAQAIMGHPRLIVTAGEITLHGTPIQEWSVSDRAQAGIFLSLQHPPAIPGLSISHFLRAAKAAVTGTEINPIAFNTVLKSVMERLHIDPAFTKRSLNEGFSGGERKKMEMVQLHILQPQYAILDETDSGLDVDALKTVAEGIASYHTEKNGILMITHYNRLLEYVRPDYVHIMVDGKIVHTGGADLAKEIEKNGYDAYLPMKVSGIS